MSEQRVRQFLRAYAYGQAVTFVEPNTGNLMSATAEVRAFALALINGPMTVHDDNDGQSTSRQQGEEDAGG